MTLPVCSVAAPINGVEAIVGQIVERVTDPKSTTIKELWDQLYDLKRHPLIEEHSNAKQLIIETITLIDSRDPKEPLPKEEQRFYNYSLKLVDEIAWKIDEVCLTILKEIVFQDPTSEDPTFAAYRIGMVQRQAFERELRELHFDLARLNEKLEKYMTMTPVQIDLPITGDGTYPIPQEVPVNATHILLHIKVYTSSVHASSSGQYNLVLFNSLGHRYPFYYHCCSGQNAVSYNSDNIWMKTCPRREIRVNGCKPGYQIWINISLWGYK